MFLSKIFDPAYLLDPTPGPDFSYVWWFMGFWILLFLLSLVCFALSYNNNKYDRIYKKLFKQWSTYLLYWSLIGILVTWFRDQNIPYLGARIILFGYSALFIGITARKYLKDKKHTPKLRKGNQAKSERSKYLPKRKK